MKNRLSGKIILLFVFACIWLLPNINALPIGNLHSNDLPIIILSIDKVESVELLECKLPAIRKFLRESACGMMNVRTGTGYNNTESGFLTLGSGNRSLAPPTKGGAFKPEESSAPGKARSFWRWSTGIEPKNNNLIVPEIGWILNLAEREDLPVQPGILGEIFRSNGWETSLISDQDTLIGLSRPGGYTMMDRDGILDWGLVGTEINGIEPFFPYRYRFDPKQVLDGISRALMPRNLILVEFGDFSRLDQFRDEMLPEQYLRLKQEAWERLDYFIDQFEKKWSTGKYRMLLVSPSLSREGISNRSMLTPIVIRDKGYPKGMLISGTTNWEGLVANIDLLPTLINMAGFQTNEAFAGRAIRSNPSQKHLEKLSELNMKIKAINNSQRSLLDWYLWVISTGWVAVTLGIILKKRLGNGFLLILVVSLPFAMLILPLFPVFLWQEGGMFLFTTALTLLLIKLKTTNQRYLFLSAAFWGGLILDQCTGWHLIRFSGLGYSAVAGSRYYGIGNEYMGIFLAVSLVLAHLITLTFNRRWPALVILGLSVLTLGWPQLGVNFGGTLAALVGFSFYAIKLYLLEWNNKKIWAVFAGIIMVVALIGWWDSLREPDLQTHLGRFFQLIVERNISQTWQIFSRKAAMNLKLLVFSPWTRTILLALGIGIIKKLLSINEKKIIASERLVWRAILVSGFAAFFINDSGVIAFGTCLAYGFSYFLSCFEERVFSFSNQEPVVRSQEL